jgi:hypothetical protein
MKFAAKMRFAIQEKKIDIEKWNNKYASRYDLAAYLDGIKEPKDPKIIEAIAEFLEVDQGWLMGANDVSLKYGLYRGDEKAISDAEWKIIEEHAKYLEKQNAKKD